MPRQTHVAQDPLGQFGDYTVVDSADLIFTFSDVANGEQTRLTERELLIVRNLSGGQSAYQIIGVPDKDNRTENITDPLGGLPANTWAVFGPFDIEGWRQTDGNIHFTGGADAEWAVLRIP